MTGYQPDPKEPYRALSVRAVTVPATLAGSKVTVINSSCRLCGWSLSALTGTDVATSSSVAVAAAAAGTLTLTGYAEVSGFTIEPAAAWPAGVNQVTITNVAGGTQTYDLPGGTAQPLVVAFNPPLPTTGTPVISVPAIVGGPAFTIDATGATALTGANGPFAAATLLDSGQPVGQSAAPGGESDTQWLYDDGVYISTNVIVSVTSGQVSGVIYVRDRWESLPRVSRWPMNTGSLALRCQPALRKRRHWSRISARRFG